MFRSLNEWATYALSCTATGTAEAPQHSNEEVLQHDGTVDGHAAEGAHGSPSAEMIPPVAQGLAPAIASLIVFTTVFGLLAKFVWPKITKGLDDRANKIRSEIAAAELAQQQAKESLEQYERNLAEARAEAQKMIEEARTRQQQIAVELKAKADVELAAMRDRAMRDIEAARRAAISEIYTEATDLATRAASKILRREISAADQRRLVEESLTELQGAARN